MAKALLMIDIQNDYFVGGNMQLVGMDEVSANAARLLHEARHKDRPRVHVQHLSVRPGATFFVPATEGVEVHASVAPLGDETVVHDAFMAALSNPYAHVAATADCVQEL